MDDSWRFRPIPDHHQLCPVCSIPHYPFCPPSTAFAGDNIRFCPSDFRPPFFHQPFYNSSPTSGPAFLRPPSHPPSFLHEEVMDRESFRKRMRVEDPAIGVSPTFQPLNRALSVDDERRLNLIRDHGREGTTQVQDDRHWNNNSDYRMDRDRHDVLQKHLGSGGIDHGFLESEFHHRDDRYQDKDYDGYSNQPIYGLDREDRRDFERMEFGSDRRVLFDPQIVGGYSYGLSGQLDRNSLVPRFRGSDEALGVSENFVSGVPGESFLKDSWRPASYSDNDDNPSRVGNFHDQQQASYSNNDYNTLRVGNFHDEQQTHPMPSSSPLLAKQPSHPHIDNYRTAPYQQDHATPNHMESKSEFYKQTGEVMRNSFHHWHPIPGEIQKPLDPQTHPAVEQFGPHISKQTGYMPVAADVNHVMSTSMPEHGRTSQPYPSIPPQPLFPDVNHVMGTSIPDRGHPSQAFPLIPPQPLFPIHTEPSLSSLQVTSSASATLSVASPVGANTSPKRQLSVYGSQSSLQGEFYSEPLVKASNGYAIEGSQFIRQPSSNLGERGPSFLAKHFLKEKPAYVDASHLFKRPYRASRPDHIVIILRGLPGSGKSYLAKAIRDIEVENGGSAPRIHAMDDYFMIEVEKKVEDNEGFKSSGSVRSKKQITKKVIEYCYEPEMEEAYRSSMLKAFKKTLDDGIFTFVIVDDRNLRVADFAQFWAIAKRSGYEVYLLEATYKDPAGCAARNIHGFKLPDIQKMAEQWEEASPLYLHLDIQALLGGDDLIDQSIQEVDMDADDTAGDGETHHLQETDDCNSTGVKAFDQESNYGSTKLGKRWNTEEEEFVPGKNELQKSKWSQDLSVDLHGSKSATGNTSALSGLIQAYGKGVKFVHWGDKVETSGFSIGANKKQCASSLIIGPGGGYNLKSNPLPEDNAVGEATGKISYETKRRFNEQLRAERESFRAVFDRRRQRVGGLWDADDE